MPTTVCRLEDLGPAELDRWSRLQRGDAALHSPFLRPAFAVAVGRRRPDARVAVVEDGGEVIAFLPFERGRAGVGRALAHDVSDYQGVVHAPGLDWHGPELLKACAVWPRAHHGRRLGLVRGRDPGRPQPGHAAHRPVLQDPARRAAPRRRPIARGHSVRPGRWRSACPTAPSSHLLRRGEHDDERADNRHRRVVARALRTDGVHDPQQERDDPLRGRVELFSAIR